MTGKEFVNSLAKGKSDIIQIILDVFSQTSSGKIGQIVRRRNEGRKEW
jgi:hypothetical protein